MLRHLLKHVRIQLMLGRKQLDNDEHAAQGKGDQRVDEGPIEADTAYGGGAHASEEDELPCIVQ